MLEKIIIVVRQAGSAAGIIPAVERFAGGRRTLILIAFPLALKTCVEVAANIEHFSVCPVTTEEETLRLLKHYIADARMLITGTSGEAEADAVCWRMARTHQVLSVAYLDQWSNIEKRFPGNSSNDWPDRLVVIDAHDKQLAALIAPQGVRLHVIASPALKRIQKEVQKLHECGVAPELGRVVFVTEPVENPTTYRVEHGFCDTDSFAMAAEWIRQHHPNGCLVMRLHPRDTRARWESLVPTDICVEWDSDTRAMCLARAAQVLGMRSFFLLEAVAAGVPVLSFQPQRRTPCPLTDGRMQVVFSA